MENNLPFSIPVSDLSVRHVVGQTFNVKAAPIHLPLSDFNIRHQDLPTLRRALIRAFQKDPGDLATSDCISNITQRLLQ